MRLLTLCLVACFILTGTAFAQKPDEIWTPKGPDRLDCITDGYDAYTGGTGGAVPDADPVGVTFGPLATSGTATMEDVILKVDMSATWIGDVRLWLLYDTDCDGYAEVTGELLCRHNLVRQSQFQAAFRRYSVAFNGYFVGAAVTNQPRQKPGSPCIGYESDITKGHHHAGIVGHHT